jgi:HAMP domain-containing protein
MQAICPECYALYDGRAPAGGTRLTCRSCDTEFLIPVEHMLARAEQTEGPRSKAELGQAKRLLKHAYRQQRRELNRGLREARAKVRRAFDRTEARERLTQREGRVRTPLARRLLRAVLGIYFVAVVAVNAGLMTYQYYEARQHVLENLESAAPIFGKGLGEALWNLDTLASKAIARGMLEDPLMVGVRIIDDAGAEVAARGWSLHADGQPVLHSGADDDTVEDDAGASAPGEASDGAAAASEAPRLIRHTFKIVHEDMGEVTEVGEASVFSSEEIVLNRVAGGWLLLGLNAVLVAIALAMSLRWAVRKHLDRPLGVLTNAVSQLNMDNLDALEVELPTSEHNELQVLAGSFNGMVQNLVAEKRRLLDVSSTFERFVPRQLLERIAEEGITSLEPGRTEHGEMAVLWAALPARADGARDGKADPDAAVRRTCALLARLEAPIEQHGGFVYYLDDREVMALFDLGDHATESLSAVYAAIDMHKALDGAEGALSVGIHVGDVVLGTVGTRGRIDSTAVGAVVERARDLMELAAGRGGGVLVTPEVVELTRSYEAYAAAPIDLAAPDGTQPHQVELPATTADEA